jgi:L-iditol 2-dehydrogenase
MRAAIYRGIGELVLEEIPAPSADPGGLVIAVEACAICGTDVKALMIGNPRMKPPLVLGHELVGRVVEVGQGTEGFAISERVTMATTIPCGRCELCQRGLPNLCNQARCIGTNYDGAYAELMAIPSSAVERGNVFKVPDSVDSEAAALTEPLSCVINAQLISGVGQGKSVVVVGAGPLGALHVQVARAYGAGPVFITQRSEPRLSMARQLGADAVIDATSEEAIAAVRRLTGGRGADVVIVAAPNAEAQERALEMAAKGGVVNLFASLPREAPYLRLNSRLIHYNQISLTGASDSAAQHVRMALDLLARGQINAKAIITHRFPLEEIYQGFEVMKRKEGLKVVIRPAG